MPDTGGTLALPYPDPADEPDVPTDMQSLAERLAATFGRSTGWQSIPAVTGFDTGVISRMTYGGTTWLQIQLQKTGGTLGAGDVTIGTVPAAYRPSATITFELSVNKIACEASVLPIGDPDAGDIVLTVDASGISAGQTVKGGTSWPTPL
jgi:hypothetical protein